MLFVLLLVVLGAVYVLVPTEQMQKKAKNTIQQVQSFDTSLDFDDVADEFGSLFEKQKERLSKMAEQKDIVDTPDLPDQSDKKEMFEKIDGE